MAATGVPWNTCPACTRNLLLPGIEYAIQHGLQVFEGGAQGEHKLARGLVPTQTHSYHRLENTEFRSAVDRFLEREEMAISHYIDELSGLSEGPVSESLYLQFPII